MKVIDVYNHGYHFGAYDRSNYKFIENKNHKKYICINSDEDSCLVVDPRNYVNYDDQKRYRYCRLYYAIMEDGVAENVFANKVLAYIPVKK